jgi:hypothetical protein
VVRIGVVFLENAPFLDLSDVDGYDVVIVAGSHAEAVGATAQDLAQRAGVRTAGYVIVAPDDGRPHGELPENLVAFSKEQFGSVPEPLPKRT